MQSVQVDVKHLKLGGRRFYQFTAVDEATRYRVLRIYTHSSIPNAIAFLDEVRQRLPRAIQRVQTDHGNEFGTDFTWHLRDLGIAHRRIPPGCPEVNGKVERSHRTDGEEFYRRTIFRTPGELAAKLRRWEHESTISVHISLSLVRLQPSECASLKSPHVLRRRWLD